MLKKKCPGCGFEVTLRTAMAVKIKVTGVTKRKIVDTGLSKRKVDTNEAIRSLGVSELSVRSESQYEAIKNCPHCDIPLKESMEKRGNENILKQEEEKMPELRFGGENLIKKRDDFQSYYGEKLFQKVRESLRKSEVCEECRFCGLYVVLILKNKDDEDVLVWDTHRSRACIGRNNSQEVVLTDTEGEFIFG